MKSKGKAGSWILFALTHPSVFSKHWEQGLFSAKKAEITELPTDKKQVLKPPIFGCFYDKVTRKQIICRVNWRFCFQPRVVNFCPRGEVGRNSKKSFKKTTKNHLKQLWISGQKIKMSGAPESWEQDVSTPVSKLNINATEFVPSWGPPPVISEPSKKKKSISNSLLLCIHFPYKLKFDGIFNYLFRKKKSSKWRQFRK